MRTENSAPMLNSQEINTPENITFYPQRKSPKTSNSQNKTNNGLPAGPELHPESGTNSSKNRSIECLNNPNSPHYAPRKETTKSQNSVIEIHKKYQKQISTLKNENKELERRVKLYIEKYKKLESALQTKTDRLAQAERTLNTALNETNIQELENKTKPELIVEYKIMEKRLETLQNQLNDADEMKNFYKKSMLFAKSDKDVSKDFLMCLLKNNDQKTSILELVENEAQAKMELMKARDTIVNLRQKIENKHDLYENDDEKNYPLKNKAHLEKTDIQTARPKQNVGIEMVNVKARKTKKVCTYFLQD